MSFFQFEKGSFPKNIHYLTNLFLESKPASDSSYGRQMQNGDDP